MKWVIFVSIPLIAVLIAVPWKTYNPTPSLFMQPAETKASAELSTQRAKIWTDTTTVYKGETFTLHFTTPNPPYLGVIDPKGRFFYIVFPKENSFGNLVPLVDSDRFAAMSSLAICTGELKADPYTYGVYENQPVFTCSGVYTFILGDNLHVDDPSLLSTARVRYVHKVRPSPPNSSMVMH